MSQQTIEISVVPRNFHGTQESDIICLLSEHCIVFVLLDFELRLLLKTVLRNYYLHSIGLDIKDKEANQIAGSSSPAFFSASVGLFDLRVLRLAF